MESGPHCTPAWGQQNGDHTMQSGETRLHHRLNTLLQALLDSSLPQIPQIPSSLHSLPFVPAVDPNCSRVSHGRLYWPPSLSPSKSDSSSLLPHRELLFSIHSVSFLCSRV